MRTYTTIHDLASDIAEQLGLDYRNVIATLSDNRSEFGRYEDITEIKFEDLCWMVWDALEPDTEYPHKDSHGH